MINIRTAVDIIQGFAMMIQDVSLFMIFKDTRFDHRSLKLIQLKDRGFAVA